MIFRGQSIFTKLYIKADKIFEGWATQNIFKTTTKKIKLPRLMLFKYMYINNLEPSQFWAI